MDPRNRSPWHGLTGEQACRLADELAAVTKDAWEVHSAYARRAAAALVGNDLRGALDAAELSLAALAIWQRERSSEVVREAQAIVNEHPATALGAERAHLRATQLAKSTNDAEVVARVARRT